MSKYIDNSKKYWNDFYKRKDYSYDEIVYDDWLDYHGDIISKEKGVVVDLGCGNGNNTRYLTEKKKQVIACDASEEAIRLIKKNFPDIYGTKCFNMVNPFPFINNVTDLVIADMSLHYFTKEDTIKILSEIRRILVNNGYLLVRVNALANLANENNGFKEVENHLYETSDGRLKRYFDYEDLFKFFNIFQIKTIGEYHMTRYDVPKTTYSLCLKNKK